ncbi:MULTISPECIES: hypothetical protein [Burkholderia cepacia complex]|uniref:Uncharacterized protein n=1 Tax=Burkholderia pseudomultivorans TaxID=1207504 RepID=A0A6P2LYP5_9BURK|nr:MULTISPECIES: hypothetical protein [Burkholderia cepacia complex]VWB72740.1 hypothetical protein BPS26883_03459 [Burkholderia pseudomultivorans]
MITKQGERLIKKSFFVEKADYEFLVGLAKSYNKTPSHIVRFLMANNQIRDFTEKTLKKLQEIEYKNSTQGPEEKSSSQ